MNMNPKEHLAAAISSRIKDGETIGVGTGTTVNAVLGALKARIESENLSLTLVPTSYQTKWLCEEASLPVVGMDFQGRIDWGFDGADEVDLKRRAIKGRGGALLSEKLVAKQCGAYYLIVTEDKVSDGLGRLSPVPVEVKPDAYKSAESELRSLGAMQVDLRIASFVGRSGPYFTHHGNVILDAAFSDISESLEQEINKISGVVENGIFSHYATEIIVGSPVGVRTY